MSHNLNLPIPYKTVNWTFIEMKDKNWAHTAAELSGAIFICECKEDHL